MGLIPEEEVEKYPLPWELADVDGRDLTEGEISEVDADSLSSTFQGRDYLEAESGLVVGDGKNLYAVRIYDEGTDGFMDGETEGMVAATAECMGVCNPDKYEAIMEQEGFARVVEFVDSVEYGFLPLSNERGITNGEEAAHYVSGEGIVYPQQDSKRVLPDGSR